MKKILLLLLFTFKVYATDCSKHPIFCQIVKNKPKIDKKYAMKLSNIIYKMHRKYHIPSRIFTAILMQESRYSLKAKGCHKGIVQQKTEDRVRNLSLCANASLSDTFKETPEECANRAVEIKVVEICTDFGISQIYYKTASRFGFDLSNLTTDLEYSIEAGAKVLSDLMKRYEARDNNWWLRYNCGTRSTTKRDTCQVYKKMVERYL